jgi:hypothetical protein
MPSYDQCHEQVMRALQKDGWQIDEQQVPIKLDRRKVFVDMRVGRVMNGSRQQMLLLEVKCFPDAKNTTQEIYTAIGQYILYRVMLRKVEFDVPLYLSIPENIFSDVFDDSVRQAIQETQIKLVIVNLDEERIVQWIE